MPRLGWGVVALLLVLVGVGAWMLRARGPEGEPAPVGPFRDRLFAALQPVALSNCELERFGEPHDGGYLMCGNLLGDVAAGYSYGISGYDGWGCEVSTRLSVAVHQYDCFDPTRTVCPGGRMVFHDECIADRTFSDEEGRPFDTLERQLARNAHGASRVVVKIDVEGAEWDTFLAAPDDVLARIDQLAVEFHGMDQRRYLRAITRLKQFFHVAHLHFNNYVCRDDIAPFPADAYEVLFVNKRIGIIDPKGRVTLPHPLDAPNNPGLPDCPPTPPGT